MENQYRINGKFAKYPFYIRTLNHSQILVYIILEQFKLKSFVKPEEIKEH